MAKKKKTITPFELPEWLRNVQDENKVITRNHRSYMMKFNTRRRREKDHNLLLLLDCQF
jgi:hypothetical protein